MNSMHAWLPPVVLAAMLLVPIASRSGAPASAVGAELEAPPLPIDELCDQSCTAIASCGHEAAAMLGLAPMPEPGAWKSLDVPVTRASCFAPCVVEAESNSAFAENVASCSECVKSYDCREVKECLATCRPDPSILPARVASNG